MTALIRPGESSVVIPANLLDSIRKRECILFLGAGAHAAPPEDSPFHYDNPPPVGSNLSQKLAGRCGYPFEDTANLQRVSLYFQYAEGENRQSLIQAMQEAIMGEGIQPSPALRMLAALPFPVIITTNWDNLIDLALNRADTIEGRPKAPQVRVYRPSLDARPERLSFRPSEEQPLLLKIHGEFGRPETVVVTEEDYLNFIQKMSDPRVHPINEDIRVLLRSWPVLFIGYSLRDYDFRVLFRTLRWNFDDADWRLHFAVDPRPDALVVLVSERDANRKVSFVKSSLWDFVPALYAQIRGEPSP